MFTFPEFVNSHVAQRAAQLGDQFRNAKPFRHVVIDDFLAPATAEALLRDFPACLDPTKLVNEFGVPNPKSAISDVRGIGGSYLEVDDFIQTAPFLGLMSQITGIPDLKYDPWYYGAGTHENFHKAGLDPHYDFNIHPRTSQHRRLNAIVYLNKGWDPDWGGAICFHSNPYDLHDDEVITVEPVFNRCVIFETNERSWHSVSTVNLPPEKSHLSRKSFTIYLYTDTRPDDEIAPGHGTVYVQANLPKHIRAGRTLTKDDDMEIFNNIARRNTYLKALYKREYQFSAHIDAQTGLIQQLRRASYVPLAGYAKIGEVSSPLFPDRFMETKLEFSMELLRPATSLRLIGFRPDVLEGSIAVTITVADRTSTKTVVSGAFEIDLGFQPPLTGTVNVSVGASGAQLPSTGIDQRRLSALIDRIELGH